MKLSAAKRIILRLLVHLEVGLREDFHQPLFGWRPLLLGWRSSLLKQSKKKMKKGPIWLEGVFRQVLVMNLELHATSLIRLLRQKSSGKPNRSNAQKFHGAQGCKTCLFPADKLRQRVSRGCRLTCFKSIPDFECPGFWFQVAPLATSLQGCRTERRGPLTPPREVAPATKIKKMPFSIF